MELDILGDFVDYPKGNGWRLKVEATALITSKEDYGKGIRSGQLRTENTHLGDWNLEGITAEKEKA